MYRWIITSKHILISFCLPSCSATYILVKEMLLTYSDSWKAWLLIPGFIGVSGYRKAYADDWQLESRGKMSSQHIYRIFPYSLHKKKWGPGPAGYKSILLLKFKGAIPPFRAVLRQKWLLRKQLQSESIILGKNRQHIGNTISSSLTSSCKWITHATFSPMCRTIQLLLVMCITNL